MVVMANVAAGDKQLISVEPEELKFLFELGKQTYCDLKVTNKTEHHVAFKVKTTSPKKYFVRPNTGVMHPWDSCIIRVTLQAQKEYPRDMQCKDKFLLQSTVVSPNSEVDDLPPDTFNKDSGRTLEECKLRVIYASPSSTDDEKGSKRSPDEAFGSPDMDDNSLLRRLKEERDSAIRQTQQLQNEIDMLKRRRQRKGDTGFSLKFALLVVLIGIMLGFLLKLSLSSPASSELVEVVDKEL